MHPRAAQFTFTGTVGLASVPPRNVITKNFCLKGGLHPTRVSNLQ